MRKRLLATAVTIVALGAAAVVLTATAAAQSDNGTMCVLNTQLRAENEAPHTSTSEAKGHAQIKVRNDGTIEWKVFILNKAGERFRAGHIHLAPAGEAGDVVVPLFSNPAGTTDRQIRDRGETASFPVIAQDICNNPSAYYVNYHTLLIPQGAVRGQLG